MGDGGHKGEYLDDVAIPKEVPIVATTSVGRDRITMTVDGCDPRIRMVSADGEFRVVAPHARAVKGTVYLGRDPMFLEKRSQDSLGASVWLPMGVIKPPVSVSRGCSQDDRLSAQYDEAIWRLLVGIAVVR